MPMLCLPLPLYTLLGDADCGGLARLGQFGETVRTTPGLGYAWRPIVATLGADCYGQHYGLHQVHLSHEYTSCGYPLSSPLDAIPF